LLCLKTTNATLVDTNRALRRYGVGSFAEPSTDNAQIQDLLLSTALLCYARNFFGWRSKHLERPNFMQHDTTPCSNTNIKDYKYV